MQALFNASAARTTELGNFMVCIIGFFALSWLDWVL